MEREYQRDWLRRKRCSALPAVIRALVTSCAVTGSALTVSAEDNGIADRSPDLYAVSQKLMKAYNALDAEAFHSMLSPKLAHRYQVRDLAMTLEQCHAEVFPRAVRTSLPTSGTDYYGFYAVYGVTRVSSMILEIDPQNRVVFWAMADAIFDEDFHCWLNSTG